MPADMIENCSVNVKRYPSLMNFAHHFLKILNVFCLTVTKSTHNIKSYNGGEGGPAGADRADRRSV